ncbi:MAG: hypothetical protein NC340_07075 [Ruminococcus flavefaciens]|nr:hypothetical protein [Ruminococcus flavefaciens]MCM1229511.1 hypothetical protein [Ruminococcus flavefaciens]
MKIIAGIVLCIFGLLGTLANWEVFLKWRLKGLSGSMTPFICGFLLSLGMALLLPSSLKFICIAGMIADTGSLMWALRMPVEIIKIIHNSKNIKNDIPAVIITMCFSLAVYTAFAGFLIYIFA